jgi:hypothetical protein
VAYGPARASSAVPSRPWHSCGGLTPLGVSPADFNHPHHLPWRPPSGRPPTDCRGGGWAGDGPPAQRLEGGARGAAGGAQGPCAAGGFGGRLAAGHAPAEPMGAPGAPGGFARGSEAPRGRAAGRRSPPGGRRPAGRGGAARGHTDARPVAALGAAGGAGAGASRGARRPRPPLTLPAHAVRTGVTWLILPVVICLSQRLSHACLSISKLYGETANGSINQLSSI